MFYILQGVLLVFVFFIGSRESRKFQKCIDHEIYDRGIYSMNPVHGESAVKKAKIGLFLSRGLPWAVLFVLILSNLKSKVA